MKRKILRADEQGDHYKDIEVGDGWKDWNKAIGAHTGTIVVSPDRTVELWCDDEGLMVDEPQFNMAATLVVGQQIVGDVIVFLPGDIK